MLMSRQYLHATFIGRERSYVPYLQCVIHGVGKYVRTIGTEAQSSNGVGVSFQFVEHRVFSKLPHLYVVINAAADHLFCRIIERYCGNLATLTKVYATVCLHYSILINRNSFTIPDTCCSMWSTDPVFWDPKSVSYCRHCPSRVA